MLGLMTLGTAGWYAFLRDSDARLLQKAVRFADRGEKESAISLLDQLLNRNPSHSKALLYRGQLAFDSGDPESAVQFLRRVPDHPAREGETARLMEAALNLAANRAREAEAGVLKAIQLNPDDLQPHEQLLQLYILQLREPAIMQELDAIRRLRPLRPNELYELVFRAGIAPNRDLKIPPALTKFVETDADDVESRIALARHSIKHNPDHSAALLQDALSKRPGENSIRAYLAEVCLEKADLHGAREALAGAPAVDGAPACVWKSHGLYWMAAGDWQRATACLRRYLAMSPNDLSADYQLVTALHRSGDTPAAKRHYQRLKLLTKLYAAIESLEQWQPADDESHHKNPQEVFNAVMEGGKLLQKLNRSAEAVAFFESALEFDPESTEAHEHHASALERLQSGVADAEFDLSPDDGNETDLALVLPVPGEARGGALKDVAPARPELPRLQLVDRHEEAGLNFQYFTGENGRKLILEVYGGGVAVLDYDGDGWPDLYFPQGCPLPFDPHDSTYSDRLFRNLGNGSFADVTTGSRLMDNQYSQGCAAGDYDNDGFVDLAVANFGTNVVFRNNGDGTFADVTVAAGISGHHWSTSLAWGDLDRDGDLDLYVVNYVHNASVVCTSAEGILRVCAPGKFKPEDDLLYLNRGDGGFDETTRAAGMSTLNGRGLGVVIADLDDDGWPEVFVANDTDANFLYHNLQVDTGQGLNFRDIGLRSGTAVNAEGNTTGSMGIACADFDGDGRLDLYVTNFYRETDMLYLNQGELLFEDLARRAGLAGPTRFTVGWGAQAVDLDLDGRPELFQTNGHLDDLRDEGDPWKMPPQLFYNRGEGVFAEISRESGEFFHGEYLGRGVARLDWNRDGRPDLIVVHQDRPVALLQNETEATGQRLILELHGVESNRDAIGARIRVTSAGTTQVLEICGGDGYMATNERRQFVGLGSAPAVDVLEIQWPGGRKDHWTDIPADSFLMVIEGQSPRIRRIDVEQSHP
jgi:tetratricopeptide (TPR) repeat protein